MVNHISASLVDASFYFIMVMMMTLWILSAVRRTDRGLLNYLKMPTLLLTARCARVQSAVLRSHVVCLSVCP